MRPKSFIGLASVEEFEMDPELQNALVATGGNLIKPFFVEIS
jgi:hypothetical protein